MAPVSNVGKCDAVCYFLFSQLETMLESDYQQNTAGSSNITVV